MRNLAWVEEEVKILRKAFEKITGGKKLAEVSVIGENEESFTLIGFYHEINNNCIIDVTIRKVTSYARERLNCYSEPNFTRLEQVFTFCHRKYLINIQVIEVD